MEYMKNGDLKGYLSKKEDVDAALCLSICTQLSAGLAYLESCRFVHRDIAARNCLVDSDGNVKIADFGMSRSLYSCEYYRVEGRTLLPIRWMAPETLFMGKFSTASDVWSFGVTVWEVFFRCKEKPYSNLTDEQVILNLQQADSHLQTLLSRPTHSEPCPTISCKYPLEICNLLVLHASKCCSLPKKHLDLSNSDKSALDKYLVESCQL